MPAAVKTSLLVSLALLLLACTGLFFCVVFFATSYADVQRLGQITYSDWGFYIFPVKLSLSNYTLFRWSCLALFLLPCAILFISRKKWRSSFTLLLQEAKYGLRELKSAFKSLSAAEEIITAGLFLALCLVRIYFLFTYPMHTDEVASYDYFVSEGVVAVTGYYPIPNNHILQNLLNWFFYLLSHDFTFVMRLPSLLISTLGTVLLFAVVLRFSNFVVAIISVGFFCFAQLGLFYSFAGRGYFLQSLLSFFAFFALLGVMQKRRCQHLCWSVWLMASVLGFYTIPTYLYSFLSVAAVCFFWLIRNRRYPEIYLLILSGMLTVVCVLALYFPVIVISGYKSLTGNQYVAPMSFSDVWLGLGENVFKLERSISGLKTAGVILMVATLLASLAISFTRKYKDRLFNALVPVFAAALVLPYVFTVAQRVYPPGRVLFYKTFFFFGLLALLLYLLLNRRNISVQSKAAISCGLVFIWGGYQVVLLQKEAAIETIHQNRIISAYQKITDYKPRTMLVTDYHYQLYFYHFLKKGKSATGIYSDFKPRQQFDVVVLHKQKDDRKLPELPAHLFSDAFSDESVDVYFAINKDR